MATRTSDTVDRIRTMRRLGKAVGIVQAFREQTIITSMRDMTDEQWSIIWQLAKAKKLVADSAGYPSDITKQMATTLSEVLLHE